MESVRSVESISGFDRKFLKAKNRITAILLLRSRTLVLLCYKAESKTILSFTEFFKNGLQNSNSGSYKINLSQSYALWGNFSVQLELDSIQSLPKFPVNPGQCDQMLKYKVAQNFKEVDQKVTTDVYT